MLNLTRPGALLAAALVCTGCQPAPDPLPSWNAGDSRSAIEAFVQSVTDPADEHFVAESDRIAVFDNDGTLWAEQPIYFQVAFALDRFVELAAADPTLAEGSETLRAAATGDLAGVLAGGERGLLELISATHSEISVTDFQVASAAWLKNQKHPASGRPFAEMVYQPMLELLDYLRMNGFKTYIVSGGGGDFMRAFAEDTYGVPPEQVVGSIGNHSYRLIDGKPTVFKEPGIAFVDDKAGKPIGIMRRIGKRPIFAGGNSDGDFEMLEWTTAGDGARFALYVHHTDAEREWAYDRESHIGKLARGLDEGPARGWTFVDMRADWKVVFPFEHE